MQILIHSKVQTILEGFKKEEIEEVSNMVDKLSTCDDILDILNLRIPIQCLKSPEEDEKQPFGIYKISSNNFMFIFTDKIENFIILDIFEC